MLGGGVIALEMGQLYARLGCRVTLLERSERIGGREDPEVADALRAILAADGVTLRMSTTVERLRGATGGVELSLLSGGVPETLKVSHVFVAAGRRPNTDDLGLDTIGVAVDPHGIVTVNERLATSVAGVWAAGDIRGGPMFTHTSWTTTASCCPSWWAMGRAPRAASCVRDLHRSGAGPCRTHRDRGAAAGAVFDVLRYDMSRSGRAREQGTSSGFIKVLVERASRRILSATVLATAGASWFMCTWT